MSTVFLSYSSEQADAATRIELSLKEDGHDVFRDRSSLPPGESFDSRIREALEESDLLVFLISAASVSPGRYTLTELKFAEQKWKHPAGHVLPVMVEPIPKDAIPAYLRAVTMLTPQGNLTAEVAAAVALMSASWWRRMLKPRRLVPALVAVLVAGGAWIALPYYLERNELNAQVRKDLREVRSLTEQGKISEALELLKLISTDFPESREVIKMQDETRMLFLRDLGLDAFANDKIGVDASRDLGPKLAEGVTRTKGEDLANIEAHLGWADSLLHRVGFDSLDPSKHYRRALEVDSRNVYAHAMWGFDILRTERSPAAVAEAKKHFKAAVESGKEPKYVRRMQISAFLWDGSAGVILGERQSNIPPDRKNEAIRVANEMRVGGETMPEEWGRGSLKSTMWSSIYLNDADKKDPPYLASLPPKDHIKTFQYLFHAVPTPKDPEFWLISHFVIAQLQERSGDRKSALGSYQQARFESERIGLTSAKRIGIAREADAAIKRLSN